VTAIADTLDDLNPEWFTGALREGGTLQSGASVTSVTSRLIGTGQLGSVALAELTYDAEDARAPSSLIVKLPSRDQGSRRLGVVMGVYEAEVRFYREIAPRVEVASPRMHWSALEPETGRFTLVLDDLSPSAKVGDMVAGCGPERAALAFSELVKLQAPVWDDPGLRERAWLADVSRLQMLFAAVEPAIGLFTERYRDRLDPEHLALVERLGPKAATFPAKAWTPPFVVAHGDYRLDNMMFGTLPDAPPVSIIDWQGTRLGPPLLDAAIFMGSCLSRDDRRHHERDLLRGYHDGLVARGVSGFSFADCWESYRRSALYPFLLAIAVSVTLERTERGDAMWARMVRGSADMVQDVGAADVLD